MLYPTPHLSPDDERVLEDIERMRHALRHQVRSTPSAWSASLRKFLTADAVAASNSIEGFRVATVDVEDLMEGERDVEVSEENRNETLAYQRMMTYIQSLHDTEDFAYSKGFSTHCTGRSRGIATATVSLPASGGGALFM